MITSTDRPCSREARWGERPRPASTNPPLLSEPGLIVLPVKLKERRFCFYSETVFPTSEKEAADQPCREEGSKIKRVIRKTASGTKWLR